MALDVEHDQQGHHTMTEEKISHCARAVLLLYWIKA